MNATIPNYYLAQPFPQFLAIDLHYPIGGYEHYSAFQFDQRPLLLIIEGIHHGLALLRFEGREKVVRGLHDLDSLAWPRQGPGCRVHSHKRRGQQRAWADIPVIERLVMMLPSSNQFQRLFADTSDASTCVLLTPSSFAETSISWLTEIPSWMFSLVTLSFITSTPPSRADVKPVALMLTE
jgi:hypothetical protein